MDDNRLAGYEWLHIKLESLSFIPSSEVVVHSSSHKLQNNGMTWIAVGKQTRTPTAESNDQFDMRNKICAIIPSGHDIMQDGALSSTIELDPVTAVEVPVEIDSVVCASSYLQLLRAYTALFTMANVRKSHSVLILCPNDLNFTVLCVQLCRSFGLKYFAVVADDAAVEVCKSMDCENVIKLHVNDGDTFDRAIQLYTAGLGFDCILDFLNNDTASSALVSMAFLSQLIGVFGHIVTDRNRLTIQPNETTVLYLKSASLHFLFDQTWVLSPLHLGRLKHVADDIFRRLATEEIRPVIAAQADPKKFEDTMTRHDSKLGATVFKFF